MPKQKLTLGLSEKDKNASIAELEYVLKRLFPALTRNMKLAWLTKGRTIGETYLRKLDLNWNQINRLGWRLTCLGAEPVLNGKDSSASGLKGRKNLHVLVREDIQLEGDICAGIRSALEKLRSGPDWSSITMLGEILIQREETVHQLESFLDEPVLEYIWEDEEMQMSSDKRNSIH